MILVCVATETVRCMATISTSDVGTSEVSEIELEASNSVDTKHFFFNLRIIGMTSKHNQIE